MLGGGNIESSRAAVNVPQLVEVWTGPETSLRALAEADIPSVTEIIARSMNDDESSQAANTLALHFACRSHGLGDGREYYVAVNKGVIRGIVGLHHYLWGPPENVWLAWFAINPDIKGQGLGQALFEFVQDRARHQRYRKLFVETYSTPEFTSARNFYQKMGMVPAGIVTPYLPCGGNMIVYYKELTSM